MILDGLGLPNVVNCSVSAGMKTAPNTKMYVVDPDYEMHD